MSNIHVSIDLCLLFLPPFSRMNEGHDGAKFIDNGPLQCRWFNRAVVGSSGNVYDADGYVKDT